MSAATPRLVTAVRSRHSSCSSLRLRRGARPASVSPVLLRDSFFRLQGGQTLHVAHGER